MTIHSVFLSFRKISLNSFTDQVSNKSEWMGYTVQLLKECSKKLYDHLSIKNSVFIAVNLIFFAKIHELAKFLEDRVKNTPKKLDAKEIKFNMVLIDFLVVGGSMLIGNSMLSKMMCYPISNLTLAIMTLSSIAFSSFSHQPIEAEETKIVETVKKTKEVNLKPIILPKEKDEHTEVEKIKSPSSPHKIKGKKQSAPSEQTLFIQKFCNEISHVLKNTFQYVKFDLVQKNAQLIFLEDMKQKNIATIQDQADLCRAVNLPIQSAFEKLLCTMLKTGDITQVKALYLTPLPCTPLRNPTQKIDSENEVEWKKWSVDIRTQTVRSLRAQGATLLVCYSGANYALLLNQSHGENEEFNCYEKEKKEKNTLDFPLLEEIPKDLMGALYFFTDANNKRYVLATQGIQIQDHEKAPTECWKMWFGPETHPDISARTKEVIDFVSKYHPDLLYSLE